MRYAVMFEGLTLEMFRVVVVWWAANMWLSIRNILCLVNAY